MQTVLTELRFFVSDGNDDFDESIKVSEIWAKINELLEKEKSQILEAFKNGVDCGIKNECSDFCKDLHAQNYFLLFTKY